MEEHEQMIEDCEKRESKLTGWEAGFIDDISKQVAERPLSAKQAATLEKIWERVTG